MNDKLRAVSLVLILVLWATACGSPSVAPTSQPGVQPTSAPTSQPAVQPTSAGGEVEVAITNFSFEPAQVSVPVGTTVKWTNKDNVPHTVTSATRDWDSGSLSIGQSFSHTFTQAGTFAYQCTVHPTMKGTITVTQ
jgi:plastocyanin